MLKDKFNINSSISQRRFLHVEQNFNSPVTLCKITNNFVHLFAFLVIHFATALPPKS